MLPISPPHCSLPSHMAFGPQGSPDFWTCLFRSSQGLLLDREDQLPQAQQSNPLLILHTNLPSSFFQTVFKISLGTDAFYFLDAYTRSPASCFCPKGELLASLAAVLFSCQAYLVCGHRCWPQHSRMINMEDRNKIRTKSCTSGKHTTF